MIDENRIKENLKSFSFPRLSGTDDERKAFNLAFKKLEQLKCKPLSQEFVFSTFYARIYPKIAFLSGFALLLMLFLNYIAIIIPISSILIMLLLGFLFTITRKPERIKIGKKLNSSNLYVKLDLIPKNKKSEINKIDDGKREKDVLFFCHLDSKGQRFSILVRIRVIRAWAFSSLTMIIITVCKNYIFVPYSLLFYIIGAFPMAINLISTIFILLNATNNKSKGAIDNASGIACVLELLNYYSNPEFRLNHFNLWFVFTGAEECGTMGIRNFCYKLEHINKKESIIFNFDAIAKNIYLFPSKKMSRNIKSIYNRFLNNNKGLEIKRNPKKIYFGSHSDGYYLKKKNFEGIGIGDLESYKYLHSIRDIVDKVDSSLLKRLCEMVIDNLIVFDNQI